MLISTIAFSVMNLLIKLMPHIPPHELVFFRSMVSLILCLAAIQRHKLKPFGNNKPFLFARGFVGLIALTLYFSTLQEIPLGTAVTLQNLSPIFTAIFAIFILNERLTSLQWLFFLVSFAGVALIKGFDERVSMLWLILSVTSAVFSGLAYSIVRRLKDSDHPVVVVFYFPLVSLPFATIACFYSWVMPQGIDWLYLILMGICVQLGQVYMTKALHIETVGKVSIMQYLNVVFAIILGYLFLAETYSVLAIAGIALVVAGVLLNVYFSRKEKAVTVGLDLKSR